MDEEIESWEVFQQTHLRVQGNLGSSSQIISSKNSTLGKLYPNWSLFQNVLTLNAPFLHVPIYSLNVLFFFKSYLNAFIHVPTLIRNVWSKDTESTSPCHKYSMKLNKHWKTDCLTLPVRCLFWSTSVRFLCAPFENSEALSRFISWPFQL
jgi:hypothetical protein